MSIPATRDERPIAHRKDVLLVVLLLSFIYCYFSQTTPSANVNSRLGLIFAVVQEGRLTIDSFHEGLHPRTRTIDKAYYDGHYYSDKALGTAILGVVVYAPLYWLMRTFHVDLTSDGVFSLVRYLITVFAVGLPSAFAGGLLYSLCYVISRSRWRSYVVTMAIALGTMIFPFSTLLFGHALAAALLFIAFFMIVQLRLASRRLGVGYLFTIGFVLGFSIMAEYTAAVVAVPLAAYYLHVLAKHQHALRPSWIAAPALGGLVSISFYLVYNWICFGSPFSNAYSHLALEQIQELHDHGFLGVDWPRLSTLYYLTLHPFRGLFVQSPVLFLVVVGFAFMWKTPTWRVECALALWALVAFLFINSGLTLWFAGATFGPRYLIPMLPFMCLPLIFVPESLLPLTLTLTIISILQMSIATVGDPVVPGREFRTLLETGVSIPYFGYSPIYRESLGLLAEGKYADNLGMLLGLKGPASLLPLVALFLIVGRRFYNSVEGAPDGVPYAQG